MVRREEHPSRVPSGDGVRGSCCAFPTGASPVPVSAEAPGSRSQQPVGDPGGRAGCRKPWDQRKLVSREQIHGPQHQVKPAASTEKQSYGRAAHVTAKATREALYSDGVARIGGVRGAARGQGDARNTRDPSAPPVKGYVRPYKPRAKSSGVQRESEGIVVPSMAVQNNAAGGKGPWGGSVGGPGFGRVMDAKRVPNQPSRRKPAMSDRRWDQRLRNEAKRRPSGRGTMQRSESPPVSRVREIRTHGLSGGLDFNRCYMHLKG